jgi:hypothetical protein
MSDKAHYSMLAMNVLWSLLTNRIVVVEDSCYCPHRFSRTREGIESNPDARHYPVIVSVQLDHLAKQTEQLLIRFRKFNLHIEEDQFLTGSMHSGSQAV